ncbi:MAG: hypothetical protein NTY70_12150 [Burkholderiales bacterium]|nr:hypothetical protein [Burkholderiales bacterium]
MLKILSNVKCFLAEKWVRILIAIIGVLSAVGIGYWKVFIHPDKTIPSWLLIIAVIAAVLAAISVVPVAVLDWKLMKLQGQLGITQKDKKHPKKNMNTQSELTVDVEASIAKAYDTGLPKSEQQKVREHLAFILPKLLEPNTLIAPTRAALVAMQSRSKMKPCYESPAGVIILTIAGGLIVAYLSKYFGLT